MQLPCIGQSPGGTLTDKQEWILWDAEKARAQPVEGTNENLTSSSETDSTQANFDSDSGYDLESLMESDEMVSDYDNFNWKNYPLRAELRAEPYLVGLLTPC